MEEQEKKEDCEELTKEHRTEKESLKKRKTLECQLNKERKRRNGKRREKCKINGEKCVQENQGKSARQMHLDCTRGTQQIKYKLVINAPYTEYEASDDYIFIRLTNENSNKGAINESKNYDCHQLEIIINQEKTLCISYAH